MKISSWSILTGIAGLLTALLVIAVIITLTGLNPNNPGGKPDWPEIIWTVIMGILTIFFLKKVLNTKTRPKENQ